MTDTLLAMDSYIVAQQGPQPGIGALTPDAGVEAFPQPECEDDYAAMPNYGADALTPSEAPASCLTDKRIKELWREASAAFNVDRDISPVHLFARAVEREHGIGVKAWTCDHMKGTCAQCHQCLLDQGASSCPVCEPTVTEAMVEAGKDERMRCLKEPHLDVGTALTRIYKAMNAAGVRVGAPTSAELDDAFYRIVSPGVPPDQMEHARLWFRLGAMEFAPDGVDVLGEGKKK